MVHIKKLKKKKKALSNWSMEHELEGGRAGQGEQEVRMEEGEKLGG